MAIDLHLHSTASDGTLAPAELVAAAATLGMRAIALTDHDSVEGIPEATTAAASLELLFVPGVELSSAEDGRDFHVLGYFIDHTDPVLLERLAILREQRLERADRMVTALRQGGFDVNLAAILELANGGAVGRAHVARHLVDTGHVDSLETAFRELIGRGRPYYIAKTLPSPSEVVALVRSAGGLPVLAHPGVSGARAADVRRLGDVGLAGIEAYHAEHTPEQRVLFAQMAHEGGMFVTGGSDYHGPDAPGGGIGSAGVPDSVLEPLLQAAGRTHLGECYTDRP